jgi:hypothetical protein
LVFIFQIDISTKYVSVDRILSKLITVTWGVVQGSVLRSLIFSIFINDIVAKDRLHMYVDDVQLYLSNDPCSLDECIRRMNADRDRLYIWAVENGLCLYPEKSQTMVFPDFMRRLFSRFQYGVQQYLSVQE